MRQAPFSRGSYCGSLAAFRGRRAGQLRLTSAVCRDGRAIAAGRAAEPAGPVARQVQDEHRRSRRRRRCPSRDSSSARITSIIAMAVSTASRTSSGRSSSVAWRCQSVLAVPYELRHRLGVGQDAVDDRHGVVARAGEQLPQLRPERAYGVELGLVADQPAGVAVLGEERRQLVRSWSSCRAARPSWPARPRPPARLRCHERKPC